MTPPLADQPSHPKEHTMSATRINAAASRTLSTVAMLLAVVIAAIIIVPRLFGFEFYAITTGSMTGTSDPGALILSEVVPVTDLEVGDVITYVPPPSSGISHLVTHRIAEIQTDGNGTSTYRTKGDANQSHDPWEFQLDAEVQPRMRVSVPWLGFLVLWLGDRTIRMSAIGLPALAVALFALRDLFRAFRTGPDTLEPAHATTSTTAGNESTEAIIDLNVLASSDA
jgi:signal peptidase I